MVVDYSQPPKMVHFNGTNPLDWVRQVERYFFCSFVSDSIKLPLASFYIVGEAREWFLPLYRNYAFRDWDHFVDELFTRFRHLQHSIPPCPHQSVEARAGSDVDTSFVIYNRTHDASSSKNDVDVQPWVSVEEKKDCTETNAATVFDKSPQSEVALVEVVEPIKNDINEVDLEDDHSEDTQVLVKNLHQIEIPVSQCGLNVEVTIYTLESTCAVGQSSEGSTGEMQNDIQGKNFLIGRVLSLPISKTLARCIRLDHSRSYLMRPRAYFYCEV